MSMFNEHQRGWMDALARLPAEAKCACGWDYRGRCYGACYGDVSKGGVVPCGETHPTDPSVACTMPVGHAYPHGGFRRIGTGGASISWEVLA